MWRWDQGRIDFFQFDTLRKIAKFAVAHDLRAAVRKELVAAVELPFMPNDPNYKPWRNYGRMFRLSMISYQSGEVGKATPLAALLALDGMVTADDYFHFLAQAFADPSPAFDQWNAAAEPRFPLLFCLKLMLCRAAIGEPSTTIKTLVSAYRESGFIGDESQTAFLSLANKSWNSDIDRQPRESLLVLAQISYLDATPSEITVSLDREDALNMFETLAPVRGTRAFTRDLEILRISKLFTSAISDLELDYSHTVLKDVVEAGFEEGTRVEKTHLVIERNANIRAAFFTANPSSVCDVCGRDTAAEFPWTTRVLDVHHVMPLSSGTRTTSGGTVLGDLVAACPTCHRAVHRFYASWMKEKGKKDFADAQEAGTVYNLVKKHRKEP